MSAFFLALIFFSLVLQRYLLLHLPFFSQQMAKFWWQNFAVGLASDLALFFLIAALVLSVPKRARYTRTGKIMMALSAVIWTLLLAAHVRYAEYFGSLVTTTHLFKVANGEAFTSGLVNLFHSPYSLAQMFLPLLGALAVSRFRQANGSYKVVVACLILWGILSALNNSYKEKNFMHEELRFNFLLSFYQKWSRSQKFHAALGDISSEHFAALRSTLPGIRKWQDSIGGEVKYPLWQKGLAVMDKQVANDDSHKIFVQLQAFLTSQAQKRPWNVLLVMVESLRASFIDESLTPNLKRLKNESIYFSEAYSAGIETSIGQIAAHCSLYTPPNFDLMFLAPTTPAVCLSDVLHRHGYENYFFYGGDNSFDKQETFFTEHRFDYIFGERDFSANTARGGWGYSDHALFDLALDKLRSTQSQKPFFATVLTLTNHSPYVLPADAPKVIDLTKPKREQILQYVDWSIATFYKQVREVLPHTIVIVVADHGTLVEGDSLKTELTQENFDKIRRVARIPWYILIPGLPPSLQGKTISHFASNVDIPPTLMALVGLPDQAQQFMGMNAFMRQGSVWLNWKERLFALSRGGVESVPENIASVYGALVFNRLIAPPSYATTIPPDQSL